MLYLLKLSRWYFVTIYIYFENAFDTSNYIEVWFDEDSWISKYVYENENWDLFYKLYDELRISCWKSYEKHMMLNDVWVCEKYMMPSVVYQHMWMKACIWWLWHESMSMRMSIVHKRLKY
jgi:hypothetical protein